MLFPTKKMNFTKKTFLVSMETFLGSKLYELKSHDF